MLLRVGVIMMVVALVLAAGVTATVRLWGAEPVTPVTPLTEPLAVEAKARKHKPNLGEKLELNDYEPDEKPKIDNQPKTANKQRIGPPRRCRRDLHPRSLRSKRCRSPSRIGRGLRGS